MCPGGPGAWHRCVCMCVAPPTLCVCLLWLHGCLCSWQPQMHACLSVCLFRPSEYESTTFHPRCEDDCPRPVASVEYVFTGAGFPARLGGGSWDWLRGWALPGVNYSACDTMRPWAAAGAQAACATSSGPTPRPPLPPRLTGVWGTVASGLEGPRWESGRGWRWR